MRRGLVLAALLPLGGCYVPPQPVTNYGYGAPGYPPPGYQPPGYPQPDYPPGGYAQPGYDPDGNVYPGYSFNDGAPVILEGGASMPLILFGGEWGYYDRDRHFHRAPDQVSRHLQERERGGWSGRPGDRPHGDFHPQPGGPPRNEAYPQPRFEQHQQPAYNSQPPGRGPEPSRPAPAAYAPPPPHAAAPPPPRPAAPPQEHRRECPPGQRC
jgi:hypothetical protein